MSLLRTALHRTLADELAAATRSRQPVAPLTERHPELTVDDAYAIQLLQQQDREAEGRTLVGRKVGLTSVAMQRQLGVDSPDSGYFFDDMLYRDGASVRASRFVAHRVEPEFAFVLGADLSGPGVTATDAGRAVAQVLPALEIIDSRIVDWRISLVDTVADNASCGAVVLGQPLVGLDPYALANVVCTLRVDGTNRALGHGRDVLGNPLAVLAWLANTLGEHAVGLTAGQVVLPGAFVAAVPAPPGTTVTADFGAAGSVTVEFTD